MKTYDIAVLGGGPGGYVAALRAAQLGKKVILAEKQDIGGTCLNRGCIPTKALLHGAELYAELLHGADYGIRAETISIDYEKLSEKKNASVRRLRGGVQSLLRARGVTVVAEEAILTGKNTFRAGNTEYRAEAMILATGSVPACVSIPGADKPGVMNSDGVLAMTTCPESVVIIGGGVIGVEFATLFRSLGKKVTIVELLPDILTGMDEEIRALEKDLLKRQGVEIYTGAKVQEIRDGLVCVFEQEGKVHETQGEAVILAAGRRPNTAGLGLETAGVKTTVRGFIETDSHMCTNVPGIYAVGDITGKIQLAHVASAQGITAAHNACGQNRTMRYDIVPSCIYTNPEIASVGLTEEKARETGRKLRIGKFPVAGNGRSLIMGASEGFSKLITDEETGEILGCHLMAPRATDIIAEVAAVMRSEGTVEELSDTIHPHPTVSEILMEAAHDTEGLSCHKL